MDDDSNLIIGLYELVTLSGCIAAGIAFKAWWQAIVVTIFWVLIPAFIYGLIAGGHSSDDRLFAFVLIFDVLKFQLAASVLVTALSSLVSYLVRRRRARRTM
jgi:hypothetical protein